MHRLLLSSLLVIASCGDSDPGESTVDAATPSGDAATGDAAIGDPQLPPQGDAALRAWIQAGHYLAWACEDAPHPARPPGAHGANRICSNAALSASTTGAYPAGAASVKELYSGNTINGYAVAIKLPAGTGGASWYWYEHIGASVVADGAGVGLCAGCHEDAPRDFIFTRVE